MCISSKSCQRSVHILKILPTDVHILEILSHAECEALQGAAESLRNGWESRRRGAGEQTRKKHGAFCLINRQFP